MNYVIFLSPCPHSDPSILRQQMEIDCFRHQAPMSRMVTTVKPYNPFRIGKKTLEYWRRPHPWKTSEPQLWGGGRLCTVMEKQKNTEWSNYVCLNELGYQTGSTSRPELRHSLPPDGGHSVCCEPGLAVGTQRTHRELFSVGILGPPRGSWVWGLEMILTFKIWAVTTDNGILFVT